MHTACRKSRWPQLLVSAVACAAVSSPASAHLVSTRFGEYYSGLLHPLTTLAHLVPWIALALLAASQGKTDARLNLITFPAAVTVGIVCGTLIPGSSAPVAINITSFVVLGAILALAYAIPRPAYLTLSVLCGVSHGYANATVGLGAWDLTLYTAGVATAAYLLMVLLGAASLSVFRFNWARIGIRAVGSWILAGGLIYAGFNAVGSQGG